VIVVLFSLQNKESNTITAVNDRHSDISFHLLPPASSVDTGVPLCAPRVHIERKLFPHISDQASFSPASSTATSDSRDFLDTLHADQPQQMTGSSQRVSSGVRASATSADDQTPVQLTPKEVPSPLTPFLPSVPPNSPHFDGSHIDSAAFSVTLPRCKKDVQKFFAASNQTDAFSCCGPTMTIDRKCNTHPRPIPPVPPVRRLPSWVIICIALQSTFVIIYRLNENEIPVLHTCAICSVVGTRPCNVSQHVTA